MTSRRGFVIAGGAMAALGAGAYAAWPDLAAYRDDMARLRRPLAPEPSMAELIRYATLAANGHNTQPWLFHPAGDTLSILPDFTRRTEVVDPDNHHLYVSLGCALENLLIAARAQGRAGAVDLESGCETEIKIDLIPSAPQHTPLFAAIPHRQSTRSVYDGQPLSAADLTALEGAAREDGVSLRIITGRQPLEGILDYVLQGNSAQMNDPAFVAELRRWIRFSPQRALTLRDGLFGPCSGSPALPEWLGRRLFDLVFTEAGETDKYRDHIRSSAGVAVFIGDKADPAHWIKTGRSFQRFALQATALGIRTAHLNQPVEVPGIRAEFSSWLGIGSARPDLVVRFGRAPALPMSPRRPVAEVTVT